MNTENKGYFMKYFKSFLQVCGLVLLMALISSCGEKKDSTEEANLTASTVAQTKDKDAPPSLPSQYQRPAYMIGEELQADPESAKEDEIALKVGATIRSTTGPQPLWDILKRLAAMKDMNVSWESDVDKNVLVDVDISAKDDFYKAIDNLLRQVDYFHEMQDNTIVVKYKETRTYQIGMPYTKQLFETGTGGNVLGGNEASDNLEGTIRLDSKGNEFNIWENIQENLTKILTVWKTADVDVAQEGAAGGLESKTSEEDGQDVEADIRKTCEDQYADDYRMIDYCMKKQKSAHDKVYGGGEATKRMSSNENFFTVDKNIGMVTVTAPRPILDKIDDYFTTLKKQLYRQITIEAKIIEVVLKEGSSIGINWSEVLKNFSLSGMIQFGSQALGGQVWPYIYSGDDNKSYYSYDSSGGALPDGSYSNTYDPTRFVSKVTMDNKSFSVFLNALQEEGETKVLSNPKISVMNGQPSLITVGRNVTYIDNIESDIDTDTGVVTWTVNTERILSGVGMALTGTIINEDEVIMNLVPVTSELVEPIVYKDVGSYGGTVGLPVINIREMSTTVKVKNGEMLVIGGLISDDRDESGEFLPILGEIPVIKYLFGYEEKLHTKRELIILLKPIVL